MANETTAPEAPAPKRRRADAERSIAAILDAALDALASDPDSSMWESLAAAGVESEGRRTLPLPNAGVPARRRHGIRDGQVVEAMKGAEPHRGEPVEALERVLLATWRQLAQFHGLLALNTARLSAEGSTDVTSRCSTSWSP